jgi:hypothetical protein
MLQCWDVRISLRSSWNTMRPGFPSAIGFKNSFISSHPCTLALDALTRPIRFA